MADKGLILIIEDDDDIAELLRINLEDLGYAVEICADGKRGLDAASRRSPRVVILDIMLPEMDGLAVCRELRAADNRVPIMMLTARSEELDKVLGLELGADDYLTKPFSIREMIARVKALVRRSDVDATNGRGHEQQVLTFEELSIDLLKRQVVVANNTIGLTAKEFDLLTLFAKNPGRAYSRQELLDIVWGYQYAGYSHTVNTHINRLRRKIETDPAEPRFIQTVWGVGYRFCDWPD